MQDRCQTAIPPLLREREREGGKKLDRNRFSHVSMRLCLVVVWVVYYTAFNFIFAAAILQLEFHYIFNSIFNSYHSLFLSLLLNYYINFIFILYLLFFCRYFYHKYLSGFLIPSCSNCERKNGYDNLIVIYSNFRCTIHITIFIIIITI